MLGLELDDLGSLPTQTTRCSFRLCLCLTKLFLCAPGPAEARELI